ncbi:MAG: ATP-binding cassette domain-containing protein [bacterium]|nr:ATP-binding cassette domain-containing protein [bacterium]
MYAVKLNNITKAYKKNVVLNSIDFRLEENKTAVFLGLDYSGKTTLAEIISLIKNPTSGTIEYFDKETSTKDEIYNVVSFMPSTDGLSEHLTVFENLRLMARTRDYNDKEALDKIKEIGIKYNIDSRFDDKVKTLSKSLKKLLSFLMCIITDAPILVLDEPFSDIDVKMRKNLVKYIKELKDSKTIIITTELPDIAIDLDADIYLLKNKKIEQLDKSISFNEVEQLLLDLEVK